ncbi:MAG: formylglycine-generating enzyme family protein [Asticcacaulis sp.]
MASLVTKAKGLKTSKFAGMKLIHGGTYMMGCEDFYPDEKPLRRATVGDFWMDETPVTNAQFAQFVEATGYVTFAELPPNPADYPGMPPEMVKPGSAVFVGTPGPVDLTGGPIWWDYVFGADWRHPRGPDSSYLDVLDHPVVHIVHADAAAYAKWAGKSLPSEAEWEYASRGGTTTPYVWGEELELDGQQMAKTFQGVFPYQNDAPEGLKFTAPVRSYPANAYGLYDMIGNVWEWTEDWYTGNPGANAPSCCGVPKYKAVSREESLDPRSATPIPRMVLKGGSHLCAPNHCQRYRPAARWAQFIDTSTSHLGFRCIARR